MKIKFSWENSSYKDSEFVIVGVPDESGSKARRKGSIGGHSGIRRVSQERSIFMPGHRIVQTESGILKRKIFDYGDIRKDAVFDLVKDILQDKKIPVMLGGDHSITFEALKAINKVKKDICIVYFDAHPDFVCSSKFYYGSVMCDVFSLKNINLKKSIEIGTRAPEKEEFIELKKRHVKTITPLDIAEKGVANVFSEIKNIIGKNIYMSIDLDCLDPAFAPGVNTPVPGGLTSNELIYLAKKISEQGLLGFDVMEVSPAYDQDDRTSDLATKLIVEIIASASAK